jgi:Kef-type K+ transport system membrane component KefB
MASPGSLIKKQHLAVYMVTVVPLVAAVILIMFFGRSLESPGTVAAASAPAARFQFAANATAPISILLLQIVVVLAVARFVGTLFTKIGQQAVIGEIAAGVLLGPSLLGAVAPGAFGLLFPAASLGNLQLLSQIGLLLFMFVVGMEIDLGAVRSRASEALVISHVSIFFPYALGVALAYALYASFAPTNVTFIPFALFMGIAMSITAFPVLARILKERNMTKTPEGSMAIVCAAVDDVTAWCILAFVIAIARAGDLVNAWFTIILTSVYALLMLFAVRPALKKLRRRLSPDGAASPSFLAVAFFTLLASAYIAEVIGIHALFGAFLAGAVMPTKVSLRALLTDRVETVSTYLLLPLFFAFTGLRTQVGLLNKPLLWMICGLIIGTAVVGKFVGTAIAARLVGQRWPDSLKLGALMNTRGLMELIVLNIGYDLGILRPEMFTMLVFMALLTTSMTSPALNLIERLAARAPAMVPSGSGQPT